MDNQKVFAMEFSRVYPLLVAKAERKGRTQQEVDQVIGWLTGYTPADIARAVAEPTGYGAFLRTPRPRTPTAPRSPGPSAGSSWPRSKTPSCGRSVTWTSWWTSWPRANPWRRSSEPEKGAAFLPIVLSRLKESIF